MLTVDHERCRVCSPHTRLHEDISNQYGQQGHRPPPGWWFCRNARTPALYDSNGEVLRYGKPCEANYCPDCVRRNVQRIVRCLHLVKPRIFFTISDVAPDHALAVSRMMRLHRHLREKDELRFADLYVLERYVEAGRPGLHVHGLGHGDLPSQHQLLRAAAASGINVRSEKSVDVQPMEHHLGLDYCFKRTGNEVTLKPFLDDNGGSLVHTSRGFWRVPGQVPVPGGYRGLLREYGGGHRD